MKSASIATPGARSAAARSFSFSSRRTSPDTRTRSSESAAAATPCVPGMAASFKARRSGVDLAELAGRPLHRFLGLHLAAAGLGVHHRDDELVPGLRRALVGLAGIAHQDRKSVV